MSIFYKSLRIGQNGKPFYMWKFRTMKNGSDKKTKYANDDVYTKHGKFLRKWKIDELPQIWNIIKRDMNIVGPRPEEKDSINSIPVDIAYKILSVKPGLTDLASIYFYNESELLNDVRNPAKIYWTQIKPIKLILQNFYIENRCFLLNFTIIYLTIKRLLKG